MSEKFHTTFYVRRLHSICGLVCLGLFLLEHIFTNAHVLAGPEALNEAIAMLAKIPAFILIPLEIFAVACPFLFHAIYGVFIANQAKNNALTYTYVNNFFFWMQRITAWYLLVFLIWHVGYMRFYLKSQVGVLTFAVLQNYFANPLFWVLYLLGMWAAIFHFCNGITTFAMTWGIVKGPRAQRGLSVLSMGLCGFLFAVSLAFMAMYFVW